MTAKIAVIGAGLTGLTVADKLSKFADVTLIDKSRGVGGRLATRYAGDYEFDHGAQFFTVKTDAFREFIKPFTKQNILARWDARFAEIDAQGVVSNRTWDAEYPHYVGFHRMNAFPKAILNRIKDNITLHLATKVTNIKRTENNRWMVETDSERQLTAFDWVILTAPVEQTRALMPPEFAHNDSLKSINMQGCYSLMLGFESLKDLPMDAALVRQHDISWIAVNSSKPGRGSAKTLLIHATNRFADEHIDDDVDIVQSHLLKVLNDVFQNSYAFDLPTPDHIALHKWRYANMAKRNGDMAFIDDQSQLIACGDWCQQGRVESAFLSGQKVTDILLEKIKN